MSVAADEYLNGPEQRPTTKSKNRSNSKEFVERIKAKYNNLPRTERQKEVRISCIKSKLSFDSSSDEEITTINLEESKEILRSIKKEEDARLR